MNKKSSAHYQREYRKRLRDQGLVKKEVWIKPEHASYLLAYEKQLRKEQVEVVSNSGCWTLAELYKQLAESQMTLSGDMSLQLIKDVPNTMLIHMHSFADMPLYLSIAGEQILIDGLLFKASDVNDQTALNAYILKTHKLMPLSNIAMTTLGDSEYYEMFGALSAYSTLQDVCFEIEMLANNLIEASSFYADYFNDVSEQ